MATIVSAKALAERERKRLDVKKATYRAILEQFSRKISNAATLGLHEVFLTTPRFVIGFPAYDVDTATSYLARQLTRLGYTVRLTAHTTVHVSWEKPVPSNHVVVIDHSNDEQLPTLANLHKTAQTIRSKKSR
jgi:hypothetical protein